MTPVLAGTAPWVIPYGVDRPPADIAATAGLACVCLRPGEVLRFNNETFDLPAPAIGQETVALDIRLAERLKRLSGDWNRTALLFIDGYFTYLRAAIAAHREEIAAQFGPLAGLFAPEDVLYSAPLPLPRALVPLPGDSGADLVPVDVLFWLGDAAKGALFAPSPLLPGAERRRRERLAAAGIDVHVLTAADLARPGTFAGLLGERGCTFWRDEILPAAPGAPSLPEF